mgnify:FL=1
MLPKKNRADKKALNKIFKEGKFLNSPSLAFKYISTPAPEPRLSFVVPKSVAKLATKRNTLRRRGYIALRAHIGSLQPGTLGVFIFKRYQDQVETLENEIKAIFHKIN